jgi:hypothetical protein
MSEKGGGLGGEEDRSMKLACEFTLVSWAKGRPFGAERTFGGEMCCDTLKSFRVEEYRRKKRGRVEERER